MYQKIIVGYDNSSYSRAALTEVAAWIGRNGGSAEIVHGVFFDEEEFGIKPDLLRQRLDEGKKYCAEASAIASERGVAMTWQVLEGEPPRVITRRAAETGADLIAMGTKGKRGLSRLLMGSVTAQVLLEAPCDVLVVKKSCEQCTGRYASALVPFDGSPASHTSLARACALHQQNNLKITALYVIPHYEELMGFLKTESVRASLRQEAEKICAQAASIAQQQGVTIATLIEDGHAAQQTIAAAERLQSDIIIMGSSGWRGIDRAILGSTAERIITGAPCPVLVTR